MVAGGDDIDSGVEKIEGYFRGNAHAGGGVFPVGDDKNRLMPPDESVEAVPQSQPADATDHVPDHQDVDCGSAHRA